MPDPAIAVDLSHVAKIIPNENPWMQPPLRKLSNEIHDNATQMMILGKLIVAHGDLMERLMVKIDAQNEKIDKSIVAINELTETLKETLG